MIFSVALSMKKPAKKSVVTRAKKPGVFKGKSPESAMRGLVKAGALKAIGAMAIKESHDLGLSVTVLDNGIIYSVHPDGTRTEIKRLVAKAA